MKLKELLKYNDIVIQCHDNPDADALASGFAMHFYLTRMGKNPEFIYRGRNKIQKSNLVIMCKKLGIPVSYEPDFDREPELLITVDCQYGQRNVTTTKARHVATVDHHQISGEVPKLSEIRSGVGSCATIMWDMMIAEGIDIRKEKKLSTALFYGLYTDTGRLSEVSHPLDRDMLDALFYNKALVTKMSNSNISLEELSITGEAILNNEYFKEHKYLIIQARPCDPNILGVMSDFSLETAGVDVCLAYYESPEEIKFSVRSCDKEVHANELAAFLAEGIGGGGGHIYKAGGSIRPEKLEGISLEEDGTGVKKRRVGKALDMAKLRRVGDRIPTKADHVLRQRMMDYFDKYEVLYARKTVLDPAGMKHYRKRNQTVGYVRLSDVYPVGTTVDIRTLEGDVTVTIAEDIYMMIGIEGEVYPIWKEKFEKSYKPLDEPYDRTFEYEPSIINTQTREKKHVMSYAHAALSEGDSTIFARPLERAVKLFTAWDDEKYYSGDIGDYIAFREDDEHDIYVIKGWIFDSLYEEIK